MKMTINRFLDQSSLKAFFLRSFLVHFFILILAFIIGKILNFSFPFFEDSSSLTVVESIVRVDLVSMPKMTLQELKAVDMNEVQFGKENVEAEKETIKDSSPAEEQDKSLVHLEAKKSLESLAKEWSKKKISKKGDASPPQNSSPFNAKIKGKLAQLVAEGNKISQGSALVGQSQGEYSEFTLYLSGLPDRIRPFWRLPSYLMNQGLRCRIRVYLSQNGELIKSSVFESSSNSEYDQRALDAVKRAAPFPSLPSTIAGRGKKGEIILGFPL